MPFTCICKTLSHTLQKLTCAPRRSPKAKCPAPAPAVALLLLLLLSAVSASHSTCPSAAICWVRVGGIDGKEGWWKEVTQSERKGWRMRRNRNGERRKMAERSELQRGNIKEGRENGSEKRDKRHSRRKPQQSKDKRTDRQEKGRVIGRDVGMLLVSTHAAEAQG